MKSFIDMSAAEREVFCVQAAALLESPLPPAVIEKDFWVCWALSMLLQIPALKNAITSKGGTSLSKGWGLIDRFSEDIDLGHEDNEPGMLASDLSVIERYADELGEMMREFEASGKEIDFPHWWQAKIINAKEDLVAAKHYLRAELEKGQE